jgi:imidazolonepropionase-like amidohydrolase
VKSWLKRGIVTIAALLLIAISSFAVGVLWPTKSLEPARATPSLAIFNITVVDAQKAQLISGQTVLIDGGRIVAIEDSATFEAPPNARVVNGGGQFLLPALWDMHTHVYAFSPLLELPLYIAYGVTNVRDMQGCPKPNDPFIACANDKRRWTAESLDRERIGPRIVASTSFMANGPGMLQRMKDIPEFFGTATTDQARAFVRHFAGQVDAIKVYDHIPREAYLALVDEAKRLGMDVVGHRPHAVSAIEASTHQKSMEHARFLLHESFPGSEELRSQANDVHWREDRRRMLEEHDPQMLQEIFRTMKHEGTWYVPTHLTRWADAYADDTSVRDDPLLRYIHPLIKWMWLEDLDGTLEKDPSPEARQTYRDFYRKGLELTDAAHRAGVRILVGTDYIAAGVDVHRELEQLIAAGLSPSAALHAATLAPAEYFGLDTQYGSVTVGKTADLLLLEANPLDDIRNTRRIAAVVFNGDLYDRAALDRISDHVQREARSWSVACKILWRFIKSPASY